MEASDGNDSASESESSSTIKRRKVAPGGVMRRLWSMNGRFSSMSLDELAQTCAQMVGWMLDCGSTGVSEWPARIFLVEDVPRVSMGHLDEIKINYCSLFHAMEREHSTRCVPNLPDDTLLQLSQMLGNLNRARKIVFDSYKCLMPFCDLLKQKGGVNAEDVSNEGILHMLEDTAAERLTDCQTLLRSLLELCLLRGYRKRNGDIFEQMQTREGQNTHYWNKKFDFKTFIHEECALEHCPLQWRLMSANSGTVSALEEQLTHGHNDHYLPILERNRNVWTFDTGVYDGRHDIFYSYACEFDSGGGIKPIHMLSDDVVSCNHFKDVDFDYFEDMKGDFSSGGWMQIPTPSYDRILDYQKFSVDVQRCIWSMGCGRMQYDMHDVDNKQVICFLVGLAGTGKSIWIDAVRHMYEEDDVGIIGNTGQAVFCLDGMESKFMWIASEVTSKLSLCQAKFQQMVSGESVLIDRKNMKSITHLWGSPGMMAGNETPGYTDNANSFARRTMAVRFEQMLDKECVDTGLSSKLKSEIGYAILKGNRAFRSMNIEHAKRSFWDFAPSYFCDTQATMKATANALVSFLDSGKLQFGCEHYVKESEFKRVFYEYCKDNGHDAPRWTQDFFQGPFGSKKLIVGDTREKHRGAYEKLPWPVTVRRYEGGEWTTEPGKKTHCRFIHGCQVNMELCDDDDDDDNVG